MAKDRNKNSEIEQSEDDANTESVFRTMGGMTKTKWSGIPIWKCKCGATTFDEGESRVHTCKKPISADEELNN